MCKVSAFIGHMAPPLAIVAFVGIFFQTKAVHPLFVLFCFATAGAYVCNHLYVEQPENKPLGPFLQHPLLMAMLWTLTASIHYARYFLGS